MPIAGIDVGVYASPVTIPAGFIVSPTGSSANAGTFASPWSLEYAASGAGGAIVPGSTIWLRGGRYDAPGGTGYDINTVGAVGSGVDNAGSKILWRNFPKELVTITATSTADVEPLRVNGNYNWIWATSGKGEGIEVYKPSLIRNTDRGTNIWIAQTPQTGNKIIHVVTHDGANGILDGGFAPNYDYGELEIYGVIAFNNGELEMTGDTEGLVTHNFYLRHDNTQAGTKLRITKNILFNPVGYNFHCWSEHADGLHGIELTDNVAWGAGKLKFLTGVEVSNIIMAAANGVGAPIRSCICSRNILLQLAQDSGAGQLILGGFSNAINEGLTCEDNYMVGGENDTFFAPIRIFQFQNGGVGSSLSFNRNEIIPWTDGNTVEMTQAGSLAGYAGWANNIWHTSSTMPGWRQAGVDMDFPTWKASTGLGNSDTTGFSWYPGQPGGSNSFPTVTKTFVIPVDKFNPNYAHIGFFNWGKDANVAIDISSIIPVGSRFEVYNVQSWKTEIGFGDPVVSGQYGGGNILLPTTGTAPPQPIGFTPRPPISTAGFFDVFLLKKVT